MELPQQHNKLKIYNAGYVYNLLSLLNRHKVQTGYANFDKTFITIVKPTSVIADITPQLEYLLDPDFGRSLTLETDYEDAITLKFYLQLKLNTLLEDEKQIEKLLKHTAVLVDRLSMFPPGS
ncbi:hypothetical protein [Chitinophaga niastensis]|nr:hypothetical protein [Chitinophaga niastensis]